MIQVQNIYKSFSGRAVLQDVSLDIHEGSTQAIIGQSGSGKSVLMKHVIGLLRPDRGKILVDEVDIGKISYQKLRKVRRQFGVLFQGGALFDSLDAFENVAFPLRTFTTKTEKDIRREVQKCLDLVQLSNIGSKKTDELSGGMRKRVALARAIALRPRYIIYDEPTSGLDPETSNTINELIKGLADHLEITSIVVTHDMHSVLQIADCVAFIHDTRMHWNGTIDQLQKSSDETLRAFVKANEYVIGPQHSSNNR
ncbi:MAG: ATP-binding cassette domain-containing protein [Bacteroidota bacterium]|nr:ATP-binding cassette domain-containing protein [Bacteroidota bacterium]MXW13364.1 ATP-binding cassette domain-containing protein [Rhodothermaceae bacterium]MDE2645003.1 ATP-binding cassette domain-containing protein [Bacteroidota bacterium]MXW32465.1 ATP-binding cassette domain-containing protein [Rhodothermaceae bacterium]MXZ18472.1 ATP-binding cassette domain-containing protein [Rhodothermaceae bacterium]